MSMGNEDYTFSRFPTSSRFFNMSDIPDMKDFQLYRNNKQVSFNGQSTNISYNPFNLPQQKAKTNFPMDFFHLPNKITLTDLPKDQEIPTYNVQELEANDPPKLVERYREEGKDNGAIKLILPESTNNLFKRHFQLNGDLFWFQTNKILNNPHEDELTSRLKFHHELIKFHLKKESSEKPKPTPDTHEMTPLKRAGVEFEGRDLQPPEESEKLESTPTGSIEKQHTSNLYFGSKVASEKASMHHIRNDYENGQNSISMKMEPESENNIKQENFDLVGNKSKESSSLKTIETSPNKVFDSANFFESVAMNEADKTASIDDIQGEDKVDEAKKSTQTNDSGSSKKTARNSDPSTDSKNNKVPSFLTKFPMIDKRPLDLYKLFRTVIVRGGFNEVVSKKLWAQIGRELGYKGKIMTSLSSSLKSSYLRILYPFEAYLGEKKFEMIGLVSSKAPSFDGENGSELATHDSEVGDNSGFSSTTNENGKRTIDTEEVTENKRKRTNGTPLIVGSAKEFKRSIKIRSSKGLLLNSPHLTDIKPPNTFTTKQDEDPKRIKRSADIVTSPILPQSQLNHFMKSLILNQHIFDDDFRVKSNGKFASIYSLRQFMEKDLKFQEFIIQQNKPHFTKVSSNAPSGFFQFNEPSMPIIERNTIKLQKFEELYWSFVDNDTNNQILNDGLELENGSSISSFVNGSGFPKIGDDFLNFKTNLNNSSGNTSSNKNLSLPNGVSASLSVESSFYNSPEYISSIFKASLSPWNVHVLPFLPNCLLGALSESDLNNQSLTNSRINIGMTFSTENWKCEDHFTQLYNYQFFGAYKRWYFIPESNFEKFEKLIEEVNEENKHRVNINNSRWDIEKLAKHLSDEELDYDILINSLENMISSQPDIRLKHSNALFEALTQKRKREFKYNQEFLITPDLLRSRGIEFTTTVQRPGEIIIKYPKTYSTTVSFGLNLSEEVNFCTKDWLKYGLDGEKWLKNQSIPSNFSFFKMIVNFIQLYDSGKNIGFNDDIYAEITTIYNDLYLSEIALRNEVRAAFDLKEVVIDEKSNGDVDTISDDELVDTFPSKVVLLDPNTKQTFILSLKSFLKHLEQNTINFEELKVELHLSYSDEKLKSFSKILNDYSIDYDSWMKSYEKYMMEDSEISLKSYKSLLLEGEKIYSAVSSSNFLNKLTGNDEHETVKLNTFKSYIENLRLFINDSNTFIEDCQSLLSIKHQQRIRNGNDYQRSHGLAKLIRLYEKIPTLNFVCSEVDQILELKNEIENFDRACKTLIGKKNKSLQEFDDLVDLGESFGISLPSLSFLIKLRDRMRWIKLFNVIEKGGDPFSDKKDVFLLKDLKDFYEEGIKLLGQKDLEKIKITEDILNKSLVFNAKVVDFLSFQNVDTIDLNEFESYVEAIKTTSVFVDKENYEKILSIQNSLELIKLFLEFKQRDTKYPYHDIRQLQSSLNESSLSYQSNILVNELYASESWVYNIWEQAKNVDIITTIGSLTEKSRFNPRLTLNSQLLEKLEKLRQKVDFSFSENDEYELTSSFIFRSDEASSAIQKYYCFCREFEHGSMIECDHCNEWFHFHCISDKQSLKDLEDDEEHYICPVCKLVSSGIIEDENIRKQWSYDEVVKIVEQGMSLKVVPTNEFNAIQSLKDRVAQAIAQFNGASEDILKLDDRSKKADLLRYYLRKFYGSGIIVKDIIIFIANEIRKSEGTEIITFTPNSEAVVTPATDQPDSSSIHPPVVSESINAEQNQAPRDPDPQLQNANGFLGSMEHAKDQLEPQLAAISTDVEHGILRLGELMKADVVDADQSHPQSQPNV